MSSPFDVSKVNSNNNEQFSATTKSGSNNIPINGYSTDKQSQSAVQTYTVQDKKQQQKRTLQEAEQALKELIKNNKDLSLTELKSFLNYCGYDDTKLMTMGDNEFDKLGRCISQAIGFTTNEKGELNKKELPLKLLAFKFCMVDQNMSSSKAVEEVNKAQDKDFFDILQGKVNNDPKLAKLKTYLNGRNVHDLTPEELKNIFKQMLVKLFDPQKQKTPEAYIDFFMVSINKCDPEEKGKIFHAFALLLQDKDMKELIPQMYVKLTKSYGDIKQLAEFINKLGPEILEMLGFDKSFISKLNLEALKNLDENQLQNIVNVFLTAFQNIPEEDLPKLKEVLQALNEGKLNELTPEQIEIWKKYSKLINDTVKLIAESAQDPELVERLAQYIQPLMEYLEQVGLDKGFLGQVEIYFEQNPDIFGDFNKDNFIKILNQYTNNKYSEVIGDKNPENLYNKDSAGKSDNIDNNDNNGQYGYTTTSQQTYAEALTNLSSLTSQILVDDENEEFTVEKNTKQNNFIQTITQKAGASNGKLFDEAWAEGLIDIKYLAQNFNDACAEGVRKVWNFLDRNQQNRGDYLTAWHNTKLSSEAAVRYDMDKDEIADLGLSIGQTQVLQNRYDQLHKNEEDKPDMA